jgi:hypothetical protein
MKTLRTLVLAVLLLQALWALPAGATTLGDLNSALPTWDQDISVLPGYIRALTAAVKAYGLMEHDGDGRHMIPTGTYAQMIASPAVNGRLWYSTSPLPGNLYIYRTTCACWTPVAVLDYATTQAIMFKETYDTDDDALVDYTEALKDDTSLDTLLAQDAYDHVANVTTNPHDVNADDVDFVAVANTAEDLVTAGAGTGADLIPFPAGDMVGDLVDTATTHGSNLIPFSVDAHALAGADAAELIDLVDGGYDIKLLLDDVVTKAGGQFVNILAYGADPTGTDDCAGDVEDAQDDLTSGGMIYFPPGTYLFNTEVVIDEDYIWLVGAGARRSVIKRGSIAVTEPVFTFDSPDVTPLDHCGMANLEMWDAAFGATEYGVVVGTNAAATGIAQVSFVNVVFDTLGVGIKWDNAVNCRVSNCIFTLCGYGEWFVTSAAALNTQISHETCNYYGNAGEAAVYIERGDSLSWSDCTWRGCDVRAVEMPLAASHNTRAVTFTNCRFIANLDAKDVASPASQVYIDPAGSSPKTKVSFYGCRFDNATSNTGSANRLRYRHLSAIKDVTVEVMGCQFSTPGPEHSYLKCVGRLEDSCRLLTDDYRRQDWQFVDGTESVQGCGLDYTVGGYARTDLLGPTLSRSYDGTPAAIDGHVGDRVTVTGSTVVKGAGEGWVCTANGTFKALGGSATVTAPADQFFTISTANVGAMAIGDVVSMAGSIFTRATIHNIEEEAPGTLTCYVDEVAGNNGTVAANGVDPTWDPLSVVPLFASDTISPGAILDGASDSDTITCTGAALGDLVIGNLATWATITPNPELFTVTYQVMAADTVTVTIFNNSGTAVVTDFNGVTVNVLVFKQGTSYP